MPFYVATSNPGKLRDFAAASEAAKIVPLPGLALIEAPPEDEPSFAGNAAAKAIFYSRHAPREIVVADDSGLEVDALGGAPGVRSARYADDEGFPATPGMTADARNNACLLAALTRIPEGKRRASYRCALAAARDGIVLQAAEGTVEGEVLFAPRGTAGFGYDPLFFLPQYGQTMAEIDMDQRLAVSHRAHALRALLTKLSTI